MGLQEDVDACAVVVDEHTGRVRAQFQGIGAEADARSFLRGCKGGAGKAKVDFLSSSTVITGEKAREAIHKGRV